MSTRLFQLETVDGDVTCVSRLLLNPDQAVSYGVGRHLLKIFIYEDICFVYTIFQHTIVYYEPILLFLQANKGKCRVSDDEVNEVTYYHIEICSVRNFPTGSVRNDPNGGKIMSIVVRRHG